MLHGSFELHAALPEVAEPIEPRTLQSEAPKTLVTAVHGNMYQDVFASYSSKDAPLVKACREVYRGLGVHLAVDKQTLRAGQEWDPALREIIEKSDLFQLFWSTHASTSKPVRQEYLHALKQLPHKQPNFIRPMTWEEPHPPIPAELNHYHFTPLDLSAIAGLGKMDLSTLQKEPARVAVARGARVPVSALPLLPGAASETVQSFRDDLSDAVHFLEGLTGLRYYPVPTLLVDEHVVKRVRTEQTVDLEPDDPQLMERTMALQELLLALCLSFHVRNFMGKEERREFFTDGERAEVFDQRFGAGAIISAAQFQWLRTMCESFPRITDVLAPKWRHAMREITNRARDDLSLSDFVARVLDLTIEEVGQHAAPNLDADQELFSRPIKLPESFVQVFAANGGKEKSTGHMTQMVGPPKAFVALLSALRDRIVTLLVPIQQLDVTRAAPLPAEADEARYLCFLAGFIARKVLPGNHPLLTRTDDLPLGDWIDELLAPQWRKVAEGLVSVGLAPADAVLSLCPTLQVFLDTVRKVLDHGLRAGDFPHTNTYCVAQESWRQVRADIADQGIVLGECKEYRGRLEGPLQGQFSAFVQMFRAASQRLLGLISSVRRPGSPRQRVFTEMSPAFGIFAPASSEATDLALYRWAAEQGVAQSMTLPGADRVLFALNARDRFENKLRSTNDGQVEAQRLAAQFQRCVLVHEHFHAILETGIDSSGGTAKNRSLASWRSALRLNESLAVWAELHFVRGDATMEQLVWDYIRAGAYPDWPYAGASRIEAIYTSRGVAGVRELIGKLRQSPELALQEFDR